jgi:hypothetical protein
MVNSCFIVIDNLSHVTMYESWKYLGGFVTFVSMVEASICAT